MNPAFSVIFLTTLIGAGQGLFMALMTIQAYSLVNIINIANSSIFYGIGSAIALLLLFSGLISSIFHLGRPERAWRSATMWRTSWLSREVIVLPATMALIFSYACIHYYGFDTHLFFLTPDISISLSFIVGIAGVFFSLLLFLCTGMIYACIKFIQEWASPLTVINYTLLGLATGFTFAATFAFYQYPPVTALLVGWAIIFTIASFIMRVASLIRNSRLKPKSTPQSAIGVRHDKITQTAQGAMGGSFNTKEFFHGKSQFFIRKMKWIFIIMTFAIPLFILTYSFTSGFYNLVIISSFIQFIGVIAERWYFFAQANHPQNIYYQVA